MINFIMNVVRKGSSMLNHNELHYAAVVLFLCGNASTVMQLLYRGNMKRTDVHVPRKETQYHLADRQIGGDFLSSGEPRLDPTAADETLGHKVSASLLSYSVLEPGQY